MINGCVAYSIPRSHQTWLHLWSPGPPLAQQGSILSIAEVCKPVDDLHNPDQCDQCPTRLAHFMNLWVSHYESVWVCDAGSSQVRKGRTTEPDAAVQLTSDRALCCSTAALNRPRHVPPFFAKRRLRAKGVFTDYSESRHGSLPSVAGSSRHLQSCFDCASVPKDDASDSILWRWLMFAMMRHEPRHSSRKRLYALSSSCFSGANQKLVLRDGMGWSKDDARR